MTQVVECFEVMGNTDTTEGRGPMKVVGRFSTYEIANSFVKSSLYAKWCVMGVQSIHDVKNIRKATITIFEDLEDISSFYKEELKASALRKLTKEEKLALGLG